MIKQCKLCGCTIQGGNRKTYCPDCLAVRTRARQTARMAQRREARARRRMAEADAQAPVMAPDDALAGLSLDQVARLAHQAHTSYGRLCAQYGVKPAPPRRRRRAG